MMRLSWTFAAVLVGLASAANAGPTLDAVRARGHLTCGIAGDQPGLSRIEANSSAVGLEADMCRAVAAAIFGSADRVAFRKLASIRDFLRSDDVDLVVHGLTWTFARETELGVRFGPIILYDGQALLARKGRANGFADLVGRAICVRTGGEFIANLQSAFAARGLALDVHAHESRAAAEEAFFAGRCDALSGDATELAAALLVRPERAGDYAILPERLSKEPLSPLLRRGDDEFFDVVRWAVFAVIDAEELGVTAGEGGVGDEPPGDSPEMRDFRAAASERLGLRPGWAMDVVRAVGNYGEIFDRNLGRLSAARMDRGANAQWRDGGLMFAPPIR
jgi:general L-amino acid transport system substrate-binding protein